MTTDRTISYKSLFFIILSSFILVTVIAALNGPTMRHDDLWYMKDLQEFMRTGKMVSNQIFPVMIAQNTYDTPLVTHNLPTMYMVIPFAFLGGPFWGWILANILFSLLVCWLMISIGFFFKWPLERRLMCGACFLIFPNTIYLSSHALSEAGTSFLVILICFVLLKMTETHWKWLLIGILTALATLNRSSLMLMALFILLYLLLYKEKSELNKIATISCFLFSFITLMVIGKYFFPQASTAGVVELIKTPKDSNMTLYYTMSPLEFSFSRFLERVLFHLQNQLVGRRTYDQSFLIPFNALILWALFKQPQNSERKVSSLRYYAIALVVTHFMTTILFQFQYRYMQILYPVLLIYFFATFDRKQYSQLFKVGLGLYFGLSLTAATSYAKVNYEEAGHVRKIIDSYMPVSKFLKGKGAVIIDGNERIHRWVIPDNLTLFVTAETSTDELFTMRKKVPFRWMICRTDSILLTRLQALYPRAIDNLSIPLDSYKLYRFHIEH
jgi:hypothetical protein